MKLRDNIKKLIIVFSAVAALILGVIFLGPLLLRAIFYIARLLSPFIAGYILSRLINPVADFLQKKVKMPRVLSVVLLIIVTVGGICAVIIGVGYRLVDEVRNLYTHFPEIIASAQNTWEQFAAKWSRFYVDMPDSVRQAMDNLSKSLTVQLSDFAKNLEVVDSAQSFAKSLPRGIIWAIVFILSTFFMVSQKSVIDGFTRRVLGRRLTRKIRELREEFRIYLGGYVKAQIVLMFIIFVLIAVVLSFISASYSLVIAAATAILDALPFFGSGITLIPIAVINLAGGNFKMGIGCAVLYVAVILLRRILEPKLVSDKMGFNPILTLVSMYVGYKWWGIIGMIIGPVFLMVIISIYKVGLLDKVIAAVKQLWGFIVNEVKILVAYIDNITKQ